MLRRHQARAAHDQRSFGIDWKALGAKILVIFAVGGIRGPKVEPHALSTAAGYFRS